MEFDFERQAMRGEPLPQRLDIVDSCCYMALKNLYAMYKKGLISRKDATDEKKRIVYNWTTDKSKIEFLNRSSEALRQKIWEASDAYKESPSQETADALYAAIYNLPNNWRSKND